MIPNRVAHNFMIFHLVFVSCLLNMVETLITENNENIDIVHIWREKKT